MKRLHHPQTHVIVYSWKEAPTLRSVHAMFWLAVVAHPAQAGLYQGIETMCPRLHLSNYLTD